MSTVVGMRANGGVVGAWHDAALLIGIILTSNWRIDVDPVETL